MKTSSIMPYTHLINTLLEDRMEMATFRKVALHVHSPHSHDWKGSSDQSPTPEGWTAAETEFIHSLKTSPLEMVAITDHMKAGFACRLSQEKIASAGAYILPGMEVSLRLSFPLNTQRIHLLVIFPENTSTEQIAKLFPVGLPDDAVRTGTEEVERMHLEDFVQRVHVCNGLCIAAHIDTDRGPRRVFRQIGKDNIIHYKPGETLTAEEVRQISENFKDWLLLSGLNAIEVKKLKDKTHYRWVSEEPDKTFSIPAVLSSDFHSSDDIKNEERYTHIKMSKVGFNGLKQALTFPDTRIRFPDELLDPPSPYILGIQILSGNDEGFFKDLTVAFSENLTCLIGPRGSGKSTIIESLRYVFGYNKTLDEIEDGEDIAKKARELQKATLSDCIIKVVYVGEDNQEHIIEATYDSKQDYVTRVFTKDGNEREIHNVEACGEFPLRLFGWSEIETLGREPKRQRELLDRMVQGLSEKLERKRKTVVQLKEMRGYIESTLSRLEEILTRNNEQIKRYKGFKADFEQLDTDEVRELFADLDQSKVKDALLNKLKTNVEEWVEALDAQRETDMLDGIEDLLPETEDGVVRWWTEKSRDLNLANRLTDVRGEIEKAQNILKDILNDVSVELGTVKEEIAVRDRAIRERVSEEASQKRLADLRRTAGERLEAVEELRREYRREWKILEDQMNEWKAACGSLTRVRDEITGLRARQVEQIEDVLNKFKSKEMEITIDFKAGGDKIAFKNHLSVGGVFSRDPHGNFKAQKWPEKISAVFTPIEFSAALLEGKKEALQQQTTLGAQTFAIDEKISEKLVETFQVYSNDEDADVPLADKKMLLKILEIAEIEWDDLEGVLLNGRPVDRLSPGQRSSAMLPLIALAETSPLVIDQPEDNLDNTLIGKVLVDVLAELKEKRQIIVATHNPNIVVLGDAEQVLVLDALSDSEGECKVRGSIDKEEIINSVVEILEGGREAFLARERRYQLN